MLPLYLGDVASHVLMHLVTSNHQIRHDRLLLLKCGRQPSLLFLKFLGDIFGFGNFSIHCISPSSNRKLKFIAKVVLDFVGVVLPTSAHVPSYPSLSPNPPALSSVCTHISMMRMIFFTSFIATVQMTKLQITHVPATTWLASKLFPFLS